MNNINRPSIVICGEVFSSNLGDPIIAESLRYLLEYELSNAEIRYLDFEQRPSISSKPSYERPVGKLPYFGWAMRLFNKLSILSLSVEKKKKLWWMIFWRKKRYHYYNKKLIGSDLLIIGGGKLLQDNNFDFPLKIHGVSECAKKLGTPTIFYACGVGQDWSYEATKLFKSALNHAKYICLRDTESLRRLRSHLPNLSVSKIRIVMDPAVCISEALNIERKTSKVIGVGIIAAGVIRRHSPPHLASVSDNELIFYFLNLANKLVKHGMLVEFFCNGSEEDIRFLNMLKKSFGENIQNIKFALPPVTHHQLVTRIANYSQVIASRLHASVTSYSLDIPTLALAWDTKVASFLSEVGMEYSILNLSDEGTNNVVKLLETSVSRLDPAQTQKHKAKARKDLRTILVDCGF